MENNKQQDAEAIVKEMGESLELAKVEEMIKDNKITFEHDNKKYRVRLLNLSEKEELDMYRRKKFGQLIKDKDILLEKNLITQYKERGIDIDIEIDEKVKKLNAEDIDLQIKLGEAISKNEADTILKNYKDQIEDLRIQKRVLQTQRTLLLEFSLENQLLNWVAQIITYLSAEVYDNEQWKRAFNSLEEFQKCEDNKLIDKLAQHSILLQYL